MYRKEMALAVLVLVFSSCELWAAQINVSWDGGGDGQSWPDANNWNPNIVPCNNESNTFKVIIEGGGGIGLLQHCTIDQLDCYGLVGIKKRISGLAEYIPEIRLILSDPNGLINHGGLEISGSDGVKVVGNVTNSPGATLELWGDVEIEGSRLFSAAGATLWIGGKDIGIEDGDLENYGMIVIDPESEFSIDEALNNLGRIHVRGGQCHTDGIFDNNSTGIVEGFGYVAGDQDIRNKGQIIAHGGSLTVLTNGSLSNGGVLVNRPSTTLNIMDTEPIDDVNNEGTIIVNAGGGIAFDCNLVNLEYGSIILKGGTLGAPTITQSVDANFLGFGTISGDVFINLNGIIKLTGPTNIVGDVTIKEGAVLEISDGQTLVTGHTTCNGTIYMKGGRIVPQSGLSGDCNVSWEPGTYSNIADFNLDGIVNLKDFAVFADTWLWQIGWH